MDEADNSAAPDAVNMAVGEQLRRARQHQGLTLSDIAQRTRIPLRHLEAIEQDRFAALPGLTYAVGFVRSYARSLGLHDQALVDQVRGQIDDLRPRAATRPIALPASEAHVPPRAFAWGAAIVALLLLGLFIAWRTGLFGVGPDAATAPTRADTAALQPVAPAPTKPVTPPTVAAGPVVLTATDDVWLRIYDRTGRHLVERTFTKGESYTVPANADQPMILTGRPDALAVTIGGKPVAPLGTAKHAIKDVVLTPAALTARPPAPAGDGQPAVAPADPAPSPPVPSPG